MIRGWVEAARAIVVAGGNICLESAHLIKCPTLLLNGEGEVGNTPRDVLELVERIPNGRLEFVPDSGHAIHEEQPEAFMDQIELFLGQVSG